MAAVLIARGYRALACVGVLIAVGVLSWLGIRYAGQGQPGRLDRTVDGWFMAHLAGRPALWASDLGGPSLLSVIGLVLVLVFLIWGSARGVALVVFAPLLSICLTEFWLKPLVDRTHGGGLAYPSGHTAGFGSMAFALVIVVLGAAGGRLTRTVRGVLVVVALLAVAGCGVGLVASDFHYATDVVGGACLAAASTLTTALLIDAVAARASASR
jgi:undecaprenyl-diphosphatase